MTQRALLHYVRNSTELPPNVQTADFPSGIHVAPAQLHTVDDALRLRSYEPVATKLAARSTTAEDHKYPYTLWCLS